MPKQRRVASPGPRAPNTFQTRFELLTYAFSRLPPRQLPLLAFYAYAILYAADKGWINKEASGKAGVAIVGVLSMVTGLLLSYRFSSAISKWDEGKKVWVEVRTGIRDGIRMLCIPQNTIGESPSSISSPPIDLGGIPLPEVERQTSEEEKQISDQPKRSPTLQSDVSNGSISASSSEKGKSSERRDLVSVRVDELAGLMVGFAFALQHHLHRTRPLPQAPLCDLLPTSYLSSLKRTEARVRFAETHAGPSGSTSTSHLNLNLLPDESSLSQTPSDDRPGLKRRGTGPPTPKDVMEATQLDEWESGDLRGKAEDALTKVTEAIAGSGSGLGGETADSELRQQISQLNIPEKERESSFATGTSSGSGNVGGNGSGTSKPKSNLHSPHPPNLPLAILKLMEAYVVGLATVPLERGGWSEARRERGLGIVKALGTHLGEAEKLCSTPPPLPLTLHLSHLLMIYLAALPCSLLCVVSGKWLVLVTLIAAWCFLGLNALVGEVGGVFGGSENHHPLPQLTHQILLEALDISPNFHKFYRSRLVARLGDQSAEEVVNLDRRNRRGGEDWLPVFM